MQDYELIIVDNNSREEDFAQLISLQEIPNVKLHRSRINLGFAGGNMYGVQFADPSSEYLFFLNNDCTLSNDVCTILTDYLSQNPQIAACTGQVYNSQNQRDKSFDYLPDLKTKMLGRSVMRKLYPTRFPKLDAVYEQPLEVAVITGAAMMVRAAAFAAIGGFDTGYFLYCEEEDLCKRFGDAGYNISFLPAANIIHYGSQSTTVSWETRREFYISFFYYFRKNFSLAEVLGLRLIFFLKNFRKGFGNRIFFRIAWFILKGAPPGKSLRFRQTIS